MTDTYSLSNCTMDMSSETSMEENSTQSNLSHFVNENFIVADGCMIKIVDLTVKDNIIFLQSNNNNNIKVVSFLTIPNFTFNIAEQKTFNIKIYFDTSPPPLPGNPLYLTNSIFLI